MPTIRARTQRRARRRTATAMAGQDAEAMRGLLGRQLASISDTLAKASQRRDAEVQKRTVSAKQSSAPAVQSPDPSCANSSLTSDTEGGQSDSIQSDIINGRQLASNFDLDLLTFRDILGWTTPCPLRRMEHELIMLQVTLLHHHCARSLSRAKTRKP